MDTAVRTAFTEPHRPANLQIRYVTSRFPEREALSSIREKANAHAAACRAIPLT
ncbi:hypothetical protein ACFZAM_24600 [Streptomyces sp. NPDC008079]|uniref:hypothetical protein n=1 Tax=Streptomyces sp. NPDC008079 TaxID=3364806 RepID=UPI0036E46AFD